MRINRTLKNDIWFEIYLNINRLYQQQIKISSIYNTFYNVLNVDICSVSNRMDLIDDLAEEH